MFVILSKTLPLLIYPLGLVWLILSGILWLRRKPALQRTGLWLAAGILWLSANGWTADLLRHGLEWQYLPASPVPQAQAIVVLGGGTAALQFPRPTIEINSAGDRVLYAAYLYRQGKAPYILVSGGQTLKRPGLQSTPAEDMAELLSSLGVPEHALWLEPTSRNTYENALYCRRILESKGIHRILLVTSALHMPRSIALFRKQGLEVIAAPTDFTVTQYDWEAFLAPDLLTQVLHLWPSADNLASTTTSLKEYLGFFIYYLRGWL